MVEITHNPLNIKTSPLNKWTGSCGSHKGFVKFSSIEFGLRAAIILLRNYVFKKHINVVSSIIQRFAPESDGNNYFAYTDYLRKNGFYESKRISDFETLLELISLMAYFETHSRVSVDTLRLLARRFSLYPLNENKENLEIGP